MEEIWKDIKDYEGYYQVSNLGQVRSVDRTIVRKDGTVYRRKGRILTPIENKDGYYQIKLCKDGKYHTKRIHQLVGLYFLELPSDFDTGHYEINHKDCNRKNNVYTNLEWITHIENVRYAIANNNHICTTDLTGKNNPNYGNHILSEIYKNNPEYAKEKLARPGKENGRAMHVQLFNDKFQFIAEFDWIGGCAKYLKDNGYTNASIDSIRSHIRNAFNTGSKYLNHYYKLYK